MEHFGEAGIASPPFAGVSSPMKRPRLSREKWVSAGLDALADAGPSALAAEPLARTLETTKGSFYWHFKDVPIFQQAVLTAWQAQALEDVLTHVRQTGDAEVLLRSFGHAALSSAVEPKFRVWAQGDADVARAMAEVDAERLLLLTRLLGRLGLGNPDFARALQATLIGLPLANTTPDTAPFDTLVDTVLALR